MLLPDRDIYCGVFDSRIERKNVAKSTNRLVECFELELFHISSGTSYINECKYQVKKGMLLVAKPGQIRHTDFPVKCTFIRIFKSEHADKRLIEILEGLPDCLYISDDATTESLLSVYSALAACFDSLDTDDTKQIQINSLFYDILYRINKISTGIDTSVTNRGVNKVAREALEYINENYRSDCSLKTIADATNVSPNYIHTLFTQSFGLSPYEYTMQKRVDKAKKMIVIGESSLFDIATELGFCSQSHFGRVFKKYTGITPAQFRDKHLSLNNYY